MKSKTVVRLILIFWMFFPSLSSLSQSTSGKTQDSVLLQSRITMLEYEIKELKDTLKNEVYPTPPIPLRYIPIWLTTMTFLLTIFLGIATYQSFIKVKEAKDQIISTQKIIEKAEKQVDKADMKIERTDLKIEKAENFINYAKDKSERLIIEGKDIYADFIKTSQNKIAEFQNIIEKHEVEFTAHKAKSKESLDVIEKIEKEIKSLEKKIKSHQNYLYQSVELLFHLTYVNASLTNNKNFYEKQYLFRGISQLYLSDDEDKKSGIDILGAKGRRSDIEHLDFLILNEDESKEIKLKASEAKAEILNRG